MDGPSLLAIFGSIAAIQVAGWAIPGPNHLTIISASLSGGRRAGLAAAFGIGAGAFTWALLAVSGIAILFELFPPLFHAIRVAGAAYLIYLGINAFRAAKTGGMLSFATAGTAKAPKRPFITAYTVMMTNPKAVLFFGSILTAFIPQDGPFWLHIAVIAEVGFLGTILNIIAALFFSIPAVMHGFQAAGRGAALVFGVLFCGLGLFVAYETMIVLLGE